MLKILHKYFSPKDFYNINNKRERKRKENERLQKLRLVNRGLLIHYFLYWLGLLNWMVLIVDELSLSFLRSGSSVTMNVGTDLAGVWATSLRET